MFSISVSAQTTALSKSEVYKNDYGESYMVYTAEDNAGGFYNVSKIVSKTFSSGGYYIEHYNADMKLIKELNYLPEYHTYEKYKTLVGVVAQSGFIHIIDIQYNLKEKAYLCIAHSANINDLSFTDKELFRLTREQAKDWGPLRLEDIFYTSRAVMDDSSVVSFVTDDQNKAFCIVLSLRSKDNKTFKIYTFENDLTKKQDTEYSASVGHRDYVLQNINLTDGGNTVYLLGMAHFEENKRNIFSYELTAISSNETKTVKLRNDKPYLEKLKVFKTEDRLICAGFYREDKRFFTGWSYFELNPLTLESLKINHTPFPRNKIDENERAVSTFFLSGSTIFDIEFKKIIINGENIIITAEEHEHISSQNGNFNIYSDIIAGTIDREGNVVWQTYISKTQSSKYDEAYMSFTSVHKNDKMLFFINMKQKVKEKDGKIEFKYSGENRADFALVEIDSNGEMKFQTLIDNKTDDIPVMTMFGLECNNSVYFMGKKGSKKQLFKYSL